MKTELGENMKKIIIKFIYVFLLFMINAIAGTGELSCPKEVATTKDKVWLCPSLKYDEVGDPIEQTLDDINFHTGVYACLYSYASSGAATTKCKYTSKYYVDEQKKLKDRLEGIDGKGVNTSSGVFDLQKGTDYKVNYIDFKIFNPTGIVAPAYMAKEIQAEVNEAHKLLKKMKLKENATKQDVESRELANVSKYLKNIQDVTYNHLVQPYYDPDARDAMKKEATFSNFLAGIVTLNPDMVSGYNEETGEAIINPEWKLLATNIKVTEGGTMRDISNTLSNWPNARSFFNTISFGLVDAPTIESKTESVLNSVSTPDGQEWFLTVSSWVDIFELKLWGYYYNLQRRLDLGYDIIAMKLFYLMAMWFTLGGMTRQGISHIINKGNNDVKMTESTWLKTLGMLLAIGVFFFSLPSEVSSVGKNGEIVGSDKIEQEMQTNRTMMKYIIRESADMGANFGTMLSDLGLDAFLSYVVHKQQVKSTKSITNSFHTQVRELKTYYPALAIVEQCRTYYSGVEDHTFYTSLGSTLTVSESWGDTDWAKANNLKKMEYNLCKKAYTMTASVPDSLVYASAEAKESLENVNENMALSVANLVMSSVALQDRLGWVGSFNVPVTYFMMKNSDMFLSDGVNYDAIQKRGKEFADATMDKNQRDVSENALGEGNNWWEFSRKSEATYGEVMDGTQQGVAWAVSSGSNLLIYNILPAFSPIQKGIQGYFDRMYTDSLEGRNEMSKAKLKKGRKTLVLRSMSKIMRFVPIKFVARIIAWVSSPSPFFVRTGIIFASFLLAIYAWNMMFTVFLIMMVSSMLLFKTVMYFIDLMVHLVSSAFIFVWAFAKAGGRGEEKMIGFIRDTAVLMIYPSLIVVSAYMFIFVYELFSVLYTYLMTIVLENQKAVISSMTVANSDVDTFSAYMNIYALQKVTEITVNVVALFVAYVTILKLPEYILKKAGINEDDGMMINRVSQDAHQKSDKIISPL